MHVLRIGPEVGGDAAVRPALLIVAGADAQHAVGREVALGVAQKLVAEHADLLERFTVYVAPCLNPDGAEYFNRAGVAKRDASAGGGRTLTPDDADRDGRVDEDGPIDLNGDGLITLMRVANPPPGSGLEPTVMIDPGDPRLMREPDKSKGERATHALVVEGRDQDGDGLIAEDGLGGVDLDKNFPYRWPELQDGAGVYPLSEPESLALVEWMMGKEAADGSSGNLPGHDEIVAVIEFAPWDTIVNPLPAGRMDETGRVPVGIEEGDKPAFEQIAKVFKDITGMTGAPKGEAAWAGSMAGWAYAQFGAMSVVTPVWVRPDLVSRPEKSKEAPAAKPDEKTPDPAAGAPEAQKKEIPAAEPAGGKAQAEQPPAAGTPVATPPPAPAAGDRPQPGPGGPRRGGGGRRGGGPRGGDAGSAGARGTAPAPDSGEDAKWLKYIDERVAAGGAPGFVAWTAFQHPDLGPVETGGFVPGVKVNPPAEELPRLIDEQTRFVVELLGKFPVLQAEEPRVERVGESVWRISVRIVNDGVLPTRSASGVKIRRLPPIRITVDVPPERVIAGERMVRVPVLAGSGGSATAQWVVTGAEGQSVPVTIHCPELGDRHLDVTLSPTPVAPAPEETPR